jgi:hypothetical protein
MLTNSSSTARAQDQAAPGVATTARPIRSLGRHRHYSCLSQLHTLPDAPSLPAAQDNPTRVPQPPGRTIHPPNPIHRLKEHAQPGARAQARNLVRGKSRTSLRQITTLHSGG